MNKDRIWNLLSRKLSGEATASELGELNDLVKTDASIDLYLQAIDEYWKTPIEKDGEFLEATYHLHLSRLKEKGFDPEAEKGESKFLYLDYSKSQPKKTLLKKLLITTAFLSVLLIIFFLRYNTNKKTFSHSADKMAPSEVSTKSGSRTKIQLPDGSSVWLNGGSKLVYDNLHFGETIREVSLSGEGYFDVAKNKEKPFIIHAGKIDIKVVGTIFNVRAYPEEKSTQTSLIRGSIEVSMKDRKDKIMMLPNDKLVISNDETPTVKENKVVAGTTDTATKNAYMSMGHLTMASDESTIVETAWVENKLVFDKETFEDVALKMERWYGVSIVFADNRLKLQKLTGTFEKETVTEAFRALQMATPVFKFKINNQRINIFK